MTINIMIVNQVVELLKGEEFLTYVYLSDNENMDYFDLLDIFEYFQAPKSWSEYIAEKLYEYYGDEFKYKIETEEEYGCCELCGSYEDVTTNIIFNNNKFKDIKLFQDGHLGYDSGYSEEDVVEAWKDKNVIIDFITMEEDK